MRVSRAEPAYDLESRLINLGHESDLPTLLCFALLVDRDLVDPKVGVVSLALDALVCAKKVV
jgi:hypothetical protein